MVLSTCKFLSSSLLLSHILDVFALSTSSKQTLNKIWIHNSYVIIRLSLKRVDTKMSIPYPGVNDGRRMKDYITNCLHEQNSNGFKVGYTEFGTYFFLKICSPPCAYRSWSSDPGPGFQATHSWNAWLFPTKALRFPMTIGIWRNLLLFP